MPIPPFLHLSWFTLWHRYEAGRTYVHHADSRECLGLVLHAETPLISIAAGRERALQARAGMVGVVPPDGARHTVVASPGIPTDAFLLLVPPTMLGDVADGEGLTRAGDIPGSMVADQPVIHGLLARMRTLHVEGRAASLTAEETARDLILEAIGAGTTRVPDWSRDTGVFDAPTVRRIAEFIDHHLTPMPPLAALAAVTGLSPSHFARKFRRSTGLSVERFVNHRRIQAGLALLRQDQGSIVDLSVRLGFSSQSHFTRVFSACTGMTPARYRRGFREKKRGGRIPRGTPCARMAPSRRG